MKRWIIGTVFGLAVLLAVPVSAGAAPSNEQRFVLTCDFSTGEECMVNASGPIAGRAIDTAVTEEEDGNHFSAVDKFTFTTGSFAGQELLIKVDGVNTSETFDPMTCSGAFGGKGTWRLMGGTGALAQAQGHGTFVFRGHFQATPGPHGCSDEATGGLRVDVTGKAKVG